MNKKLRIILVSTLLLLIGVILFSRVYTVSAHMYCPYNDCKDPVCKGLLITLWDERPADGNAKLLCLGTIEP